MSTEITNDFADGLGLYSPETIMSALEEIKKEFSNDDEVFQEFLKILSDHGGDLSQITKVTHQPVSIIEFMEDDYFMGKYLGTIWPEVKKTAIESINGGYVEFLGMGAIGTAKTTLAIIINGYHLYLTSIEKYPQLRFGLMPHSDITFAMLNKNATLAKDVTYARFKSLIETIPYFREKFPFDPNKKNVLNFPNNIDVIHGAATSDKALGMNVIGGIIDEINFFSIIENSKKASSNNGTYNQAKEVYNTLVRRRKSRFQTIGKLPGCICSVSSVNSKDDFLEERKKEAITENDGLTYIYDNSQWDVLPAKKPNGDIRFTGEKFTVELGDERHNSRILSEEVNKRDESETIEVPIEFEKDFVDDIEGALKDLAGRATSVSMPFFYNRDKVFNAIALHEKESKSLLFTSEEATFTDENIIEEIEELTNSLYNIPHPEAYRAIHLDLATTGDSCGFSMGYSPEVKLITKRRNDKVEAEEALVVKYDGHLEIKPPSGGEILFYLIRELIYYLKDDMEIPIKWISFDGFQSTDSRQILKKKGFLSKLISVEDLESYQSFREAFHQDRIYSPEHTKMFSELIKLKRGKRGSKDVVDHLPNFSKDVSDAACGVYKNLNMKRQTQLTNNSMLAIEGTGEKVNTKDRKRREGNRR